MEDSRKMIKLWVVKVFHNDLQDTFVGKVYTFTSKNDAEGCVINLNQIFSVLGLGIYAEVVAE